MGESGTAGATGPNGTKGEKGAPGTTGERGSPGTPGAGLTYVDTVTKTGEASAKVGEAPILTHVAASNVYTLEFPGATELKGCAVLTSANEASTERIGAWSERTAARVITVKTYGTSSNKEESFSIMVTC
jgi:hypothetical protein